MTSPSDGDLSAEELILDIALTRAKPAFAQLFARFAPRFKSFYLRRGWSAAVAEELVQEAMLSVWRHAESFDPRRGAAEAWLFTIARNLAVDAHRADRGAPPLELVLALRHPEPPPPADDLIAVAHSSERLRQALAILPEQQSVVIALSYFDGKSHEQIAETLGLPLGTVKSRLRLGAKRLRQLLSDEL